MSSSRRRAIITRLRNDADKLESETRVARHRLEIDNKQVTILLNIAEGMRAGALLLENLPSE